MNPRSFCRESGYHKTLILTYAFDPVFFERVVLHDLWAGGTNDILVLAEQKQIELSLTTLSEQLAHLGKRYLLAGAKHSGAFHPKLIVRFGDDHGVVLAGSGNITSSGWGGNKELGTAWALGPGRHDDGAWLAGLLDNLKGWSGNDLERQALDRLRDTPWLTRTMATSASIYPVIHSQPNSTLASTLSLRWSGRRFEQVKILTGSSDASGAFLRWAHKQFGILRATIVVTPTSASFDPRELHDLPIELRLIEAGSDSPMHAKFYWFDGIQGQAALMGSANCSAAAWLQPTTSGGNVETMVVYDHPDADSFAELLTIFNAPTCAAEDMFTGNETESANVPERPRSFYQLNSLRWDGGFQRVHAQVTPPPSGSLPTVSLLMRDEVHTMCASSENVDGWWTSEPIENLGAEVVLGALRLQYGDESWDTGFRWLDDPESLRRASQSARLREPLQNLKGDGTDSERRRMLASTKWLADILIDDSTALSDPLPRPRLPGTGNDENAVPAPVDPEALICELQEMSSMRDGRVLDRSSGLSLGSIFGMLFKVDEDVRDGLAESDRDDEKEIGRSGKKTRSSRSDQGDSEKNNVTDRDRAKLAAQVDDFLEKLSKPAFAARCTATQVVESVAFPLALAINGQNEGWVSAEVAREWAVKIIYLLFRGKQRKALGLLPSVAKRYEEAGQWAIFSDVVGDGRLWAVLIAMLGRFHLRSVGSYIDEAVLLREVVNERELLTTAPTSRVSRLIAALKIDGAEEYIVNWAPRLIECLSRVESILDQAWTAEMESHTSRSKTNFCGDLLWRVGAGGWAVNLKNTAPGEKLLARRQGHEVTLASGYYINVSELAYRNRELHALLVQLDGLRKDAAPLQLRMTWVQF